MDFDFFSEDQKTVETVVRNLKIIGDAARNFPTKVKPSLACIQWNKIVALRHILTHEYFRINKQIVWDVVQTKLASFKTACEKAIH